MLHNIRSLFTKQGGSWIHFKQFSSKMSATAPLQKLVWLDMEMTGLDVETDQILEIACVVTDVNLNLLSEGLNLIVKQPDSILSNMNQWCVKQHGKSGLTEASRKSNIDVEEAEEIVFKFISQHVEEYSSPLAGNSVYMDRIFLRKYMPKINNYLHYRILDVSTIKELCRFWNAELAQKVPQKSFQHRALDDIKESIEELKFYQKNFFNIPQ